MADSFARRESVLTIVSDAMGELGLEPLESLVGNGTPDGIQWLALVNGLGRDLVTDPDKWQFLQREFTITTVIGEPAYDLPADFAGFDTDASWNRTTRLPVLGSLTEQEWQMLKARLLTGTTFTALFIIEGDQVVFYDEPSAVETIVMPYTGRGWLTDATGVDYKDRVSADTDLVLFDTAMFKSGLKHYWREAKGFDTTSSRKNFNSRKAAARAIDKPGRSLSLVGTAGFPYLSGINVPDTGYGA
jgi:hypothetical protein